MGRWTRGLRRLHGTEGCWARTGRVRAAGLSLLIVCAVGVVSLGSGAAAVAWAAPASWRVADGESLRWQGVHRQQTSATCGPASIVTLLTYYMGIPVEEEEAARRARLWAGGDDAPLDGGEAVTMRGLQAALASWGVAAYGLAMSLDGVEAYLAEVGIPLIVRVTWPDPHFSVVAGTADGHVLLADSSLGWRALPYNDFLTIWDGIALAVDPDASPLLSHRTINEGLRSGRGPEAASWTAAEALGDLRARLRHLRRGVVGR